MTTVTSKASACAKFILLGEHFIVPRPAENFSVPAIAYPLKELFCEVSVSLSAYPRYELLALPLNENKEKIESLMARATYAAGNALGIDISFQPLHVRSRANFPASRGFGSSAAFSVALSKALEKLRLTVNPKNQPHGDLEIFRAAQAVEKIFHGNPSGLDASVILAEQPVRFENGMIMRTIDNHSVDFVVVDSGEREECLTLVSRVSQIRDDYPDRWKKFALQITDLVDRAEKALKSEVSRASQNEVAQCVKESHGVLSELGLSQPHMEELIRKAETCGALAGKVSGAGGGGAIVLVAEKGSAVKLSRELTQNQIPVLAVFESAKRNG